MGTFVAELVGSGFSLIAVVSDGLGMTVAVIVVVILEV